MLALKLQIFVGNWAVKQGEITTLTSKVDMANIFANDLLLRHPADMEKH